jgi:hypothetical protein
VSEPLDQPANTLRHAMEDGTPAHECQCADHECTTWVRCSEIDPCPEPHLCRPCEKSCEVIQ